MLFQVMIFLIRAEPGNPKIDELHVRKSLFQNLRKQLAALDAPVSECDRITKDHHARDALWFFELVLAVAESFRIDRDVISTIAGVFNHLRIGDRSPADNGVVGHHSLTEHAGHKAGRHFCAEQPAHSNQSDNDNPPWQSRPAIRRPIVCVPQLH
jgi:hypothetical protein